MKNKFFPAPEVEQIGAALIEKHFPDLLMEDYRHNRPRLEYVFSVETPVQNGMEKWGDVRKISGVNSFIKRRDEISWEPERTDEEIEAIEDEDDRMMARENARRDREAKLAKGVMPFFLVRISKPIWDKLEPSGREALVFHELKHCTVGFDNDGYLQLGTRGHDYEAFNEEVELYGLWRGNAISHFNSMKRGQMQLPLDDEGATVTIQASAGGKMSEPVTLRSQDLSKLDAMMASGKEGT